MNLELTIRPVTKECWKDFEALFEGRGSPHYCWCMAWRVNENKNSIPGKAGKKASMKNRVDSGIPIGILAYHDDQPIAWCSIAPRESYRKLGGDGALQDVWSIVCFFVQRRFRNRGVASSLLSAAVKHARHHGAKFVEGYPVDPGSGSYRFMGLVPAFSEVGFQFVKKAGSRRNVMVLALET